MEFIVRWVFPMLILGFVSFFLSDFVIIPFLINIGLSLSVAGLINFVLWCIIGYMFGSSLANYWSDK